MSNVAVNDAGDVLILRDGQWAPAQVAQNGRGERLYLDGQQWLPVPGGRSVAGQVVDAAGAAARGAGEAIAATPGSWWGRRARDVVEGLASFPSAAAEAMNPAGMVTRMMAPQAVRDRMGPATLSEVAHIGANAAGLASPQTPGERMTSAITQGVIGAIPTMGVGAGTGAAQRGVNYLSQLVGGGTGGGAAEYVAQQGYGPGAQMAAGLIGGLGGAGAVQGAAVAGRAVPAMLQPFGQHGREAMVADMLRQSSADPANLAARIDAGVNAPNARLPGVTPTTAVAARDPGLLAIESSVRAGALGPEAQQGIREAQTRRAAAQVGYMGAMQDGSTPGERGAALRGERQRPGEAGSGLRLEQQRRQQQVSRAYEAIDPDGTARLPTHAVRAVADQELAQRWGEGSGAIPEPVQRLLDTVTNAGDAVSWRFMQNVRRQANDILGDGAASDSAKATARRVVARIDATAESAAVPVQPAGSARTLADMDRAEVAEGAAARPDVAAVLGDMRSATADAQSGGLSLAQFIRQRGGLADSAREIADARRMPGMFNRAGLNTDRAMQAAIDAGYYPGRTIQHDAMNPGATLTRAEFLRDIGEELNRRGRIYPAQTAAAREDIGARAGLRNEVERELDGYGLGLRDDPNRIAAAVRGADENAPAAPINADDGTFYIPPEQRFTPEQAAQWRAAGHLRREMGQDFERSQRGANATGRILQDAGYGAPRLADEGVPGVAIANPSSVLQTLKAANYRPEVRQAMQGQFMDNLARAATGAAEVVDAAGNATRLTTPAGFNRFWDQHKATARILFGAEGFRRLQLLARDFSEASIAANTGATRNSQTVQNMTVGNMMARITNGLIDPETAFGASAGRPLAWLYREPERMTRELLGQAMVDPRLAGMLLSRATPANVRRASDYIESSMRERLTGAAGVAAIRQGVRTSGEEQRRQAQ